LARSAAFPASLERSAGFHSTGGAVFVASSAALPADSDKVGFHADIDFLLEFANKAAVLAKSVIVDLAQRTFIG
jgi:hypothetical protein